ncbi:hypothetical protein P9B03_10865 [Metasolibacillus meyeri]|uniref:DUF4276 family protein n=1 Tax=Metasolibacillus meyeri TaxID=1071052 RepID=A0AAW9NSS9_9BACL|nr:hypothetical protein [Metasolibacillus meyeri]MEC1178985.1 hypothetical protein [Metasolibacillus meyeri]
MAKAQKKVVILLVEGDTDELLLIERLRQLFKDKEIRFEPQHGDIFYQRERKEQAIKEVIGEKVKEILMKRKFKPSNVLAVLHILDTDGCFIAPEHITVDAEQSVLTQYNADCITVNSEEQKVRIEERNEIRSRNVHTMSKATHIAQYAYQAYYFSRHLEHVVFNEMNPCKEDKFEKIENFLETLEMPIENFLAQYMPIEQQDEYSMAHEKSWEFIAENMNSLKQYTNASLMFQFLENDSKHI